MDEETAKEIQDLQDQLASLVNRKRKRDDTAQEDEIKHLKKRLTDSLKRCQSANMKSAQLSKTNKELQAEIELLEKSTKEQARSIKLLERSVEEQANSIKTLNGELHKMEDENMELMAEVEGLEMFQLAAENAFSAIKRNLRPINAIVEHNSISCKSMLQRY